MPAYVVDTSVFGVKAQIVDLYVTAVNEIAEQDEKLGDTAASGASFMRTVAESNTDAVAIANAFVEQLKALGTEARAVVMHQVTTNADLRKNLREYVSTNQPKEQEKVQSEKEVAAIWEARSATQKNAASLWGAFKTGTLTADELALLTDMVGEPPAGKRGAAPGARGPQGRKLPNTVSWTIKGENVGIKTGTQAAKLVGARASDVRLAIEKAYADSTPENFTVVVNGIQMDGTVLSSETPDTDTDENEVDETEVDEFDFDSLEDELDLDDEVDQNEE